MGGLFDLACKLRQQGRGLAPPLGLAVDGSASASASSLSISDLPPQPQSREVTNHASGTSVAADGEPAVRRRNTNTSLDANVPKETILGGIPGPNCGSHFRSNFA